MSDLVPALQGFRDLGIGDPAGFLETSKSCFETISAELPIAALFGMEEGDQDAHPLLVEQLIPVCVAIELLIEGKEFPDGLCGSTDALKGGLDQMNAPKLIVLHEGKPVWGAVNGQGGKEAA
jgi:hypothetical protein